MGKLSLTSPQNRSNFNIKVKAFPENVIIQIGKPLFGNLLKIQFNYSSGLSFNQKIDSRYLSSLKEFKNKDYRKFLNSCFNNFNINEKVFILKKDNVGFECIHHDKNTFILKKYDFELKCSHQNNDEVSVHMMYKTELKIVGLLKHG